MSPGGRAPADGPGRFFRRSTDGPWPEVGLPSFRHTAPLPQAVRPGGGCREPGPRAPAWVAFKVQGTQPPQPGRIWGLTGCFTQSVSLVLHAPFIACSLARWCNQHVCWVSGAHWAAPCCGSSPRPLRLRSCKSRPLHWGSGTQSSLVSSAPSRTGAHTRVRQIYTTVHKPTPARGACRKAPTKCRV